MVRVQKLSPPAWYLIWKKWGEIPYQDEIQQLYETTFSYPPNLPLPIAQLGVSMYIALMPLKMLIQACLGGAGQLVEHEALDLGVMSLSPMPGIKLFVCF